MSSNKGIFSNESKSNKKIKPFIVAFAVFIVVLSVFSVVLFMYSLDFDINNLIETTTEPEETTVEDTKPSYSVDDLTGNSNIMFVITDNDGKVESVLCTLLDYGNKSFKVKQIDGDAQYLCDDKYRSINGIYSEMGKDGLYDFVSSKWNIQLQKYVVFKRNDLRKFLSLFDGITINVAENINYTSSDFNLELQKGKQELSGEKVLNYLKICNDDNKEQIICDVIISVLTPKYIERAESLFKRFANLSKTDISVIDFFDSLEALEIYCNSTDKFLPKPYGEAV